MRAALNASHTFVMEDVTSLSDDVQSFRRRMLVGTDAPVQSKVERRPLSSLTLCPDPSSVAMNDALHRCQSDSGSWKLVLIVKTFEDAKELVGVFHVESSAIIAYEIRHLPIALRHRTKSMSDE